MMRPEDHEPVCIVNGCGRSQVHRIGECAPDDAPVYSDGAAEAELVDDALSDAHAVTITAPNGETWASIVSTRRADAIWRYLRLVGTPIVTTGIEQRSQLRHGEGP